jgi:predicted nucleic acid-binding protein
MPAKVVDASALAAITFQEPRFAEAVALLEDTELHAPTLLAYELTSVARKKALLYPSLVRELAANLEDALSTEVQWAEVDHREVLALALATGLSTYDASYLYLALILNVPIVTFDEGLRRATDQINGGT